MICTESRRNFAAFLARLASEAATDDEWLNLVMAHYPDGELEGIRRDLVRLSIRRNPTGIIATTWRSEDRRQMVQWIERLERPAKVEAT